MTAACKCHDAARWEETEEPKIYFHEGALSKVVYFYICFTCGVCWRENHHVERSYQDESHIEHGCW